jgi:arsenate reductase (glutaredoxin)
MLAQAVRFAIVTTAATIRTTFMSELTIYHNPACSKSRETLALIKASGHEPRIVEYLKTPPSEAELAGIVRKLGIRPLELVRRTEQIFKDKYAGRNLGDKEWIKAMIEHPILLQRPIVVRGEAAAIGRPPENVKPLLKSS